MFRVTLAASLWLAASGCEQGAETSTTPAGSGSETAGSGSARPAAGSGGGFSADLAKQLGDPTDGGVVAMGGSGQGSANANAGSANVAADPKAGSANVAADPKAGSASARPDAKAGSATGKPDVKVDGAVAAGSNAPPKVVPKPPVQVPAELKLIKIALLPNWDRDLEGAGTISFTVKIPSRAGETALFVFRYGFEDPTAPADRDAYKKWLADQKILNAAMDRQRGAAWYIEGTDGSGRGAFRFVVNYGGRKLICFGSLYKDAAGNALGDLRDQALIQAKQICESLTL